MKKPVLKKNEFKSPVDFSFEFTNCENGYSTHGEKNDEELRKKWFTRQMEIDEYTKSNRKKAYEMISEYIDCLWD